MIGPLVSIVVGMAGQVRNEGKGEMEE